MSGDRSTKAHLLQPGRRQAPSRVLEEFCFQVLYSHPANGNYGNDAFEQMFNFSQDKCSIAFIIASFSCPRVCVCEGGERAKREEGKGEGGRGDREEVARERGREREMLP